MNFCLKKIPEFQWNLPIQESMAFSYFNRTCSSFISTIAAIHSVSCGSLLWMRAVSGTILYEGSVVLKCTHSHCSERQLDIVTFRTRFVFFPRLCARKINSKWQGALITSWGSSQCQSYCKNPTPSQTGIINNNKQPSKSSFASPSWQLFNINLVLCLLTNSWKNLYQSKNFHPACLSHTCTHLWVVCSLINTWPSYNYYLQLNTTLMYLIFFHPY